MGVGYLEMLDTPYNIIIKDLEIMDLEAETRKKKEAKK